MLLELGVPLWHSGLTAKQTADIERVQKTVLFVLLENKYISYKAALRKCGLQSLGERRDQLCLNFSKKKIKKNPSLFDKITSKTKTRQKGNLVREYFCKNKRFYMSSLPYLSRLINAA